MKQHIVKMVDEGFYKNENFEKIFWANNPEEVIKIINESEKQNIMEGKHLKLEKRQLEGRKTSVYLVVNKTTNETLAKLVFFPKWRKYVLETNEGIVFDEGCLKEVISFLKIVQDDWRKERSRRGAAEK